MSDFKAVPIPDRMLHLQKDSRGYPQPWVLLTDNTGKTHFTINDDRKTLDCIKDLLCSICGQELGNDLWFVGGPGSAFLEGGQYADPPVHHCCGQYALKVCPYMAMPSWNNKKIGPTIAKQLDTAPENLPEGFGGFYDLDEDDSREGWNSRPPVFVFMKAYSYAVKVRHPHLMKPSWATLESVEFWRHGQRIPQEEGMVLARKRLTEMMTSDQAPAPKEGA